MGLKPSGEMYLKTIYILTKKIHPVRSIDIAEYMKFSKPSVSRAVGNLRKNNYISINNEGHIFLTPKGLDAAQNIYNRHDVLTKALINIGVSEKTAANDACEIEHVISEEAFEALKRHIKDK
ncbi:MAG: metal-dependent transcriptional regulator [Bacilli bacterium]